MIEFEYPQMSWEDKEFIRRRYGVLAFTELCIEGAKFLDPSPNPSESRGTNWLRQVFERDDVFFQQTFLDKAPIRELPQEFVLMILPDLMTYENKLEGFTGRSFGELGLSPGQEGWIFPLLVERSNKSQLQAVARFVRYQCSLLDQFAIAGYRSYWSMFDS